MNIPATEGGGLDPRAVQEQVALAALARSLRSEQAQAAGLVSLISQAAQAGAPAARADGVGRIFNAVA